MRYIDSSLIVFFCLFGLTVSPTDVITSPYTTEINGHEYTIQFVPIEELQEESDALEDCDYVVYGDCGDPESDPNIRIADDLGDLELEIIIHECLHASNWQILSEEYVTDTAEDIARVLRVRGYKR